MEATKIGNGIFKKTAKQHKMYNNRVFGVMKFIYNRCIDMFNELGLNNGYDTDPAVFDPGLIYAVSNIISYPLTSNCHI
jgi:hypothetical protein